MTLLDEQGRECLEVVSEGEKSFADDDLQSAPVNNEVITSSAEELLEVGLQFDFCILDIYC